MKELMHKASELSISTPICVRCKVGVGDVRMVGCGCGLHTRCTRLPTTGEALVQCPQCQAPCRGISLLPLSFTEMDEARRSAASSKQPSTGSSNASNAGKALVSSQADAPEIDDPEKCSSYEDEFLQSTAGTIISEDSEPRTGRWTAAETSYVDELIVKFGLGALPIPAGVKLHEFLASILLCKGSRLTKKMKNAKLSTKSYTRNTGYIADLEDAIEFSALEEAFFHSIPCAMERSAIKFHMQRQWREMFCRVCSDLSLPLKAESWLNSVEEVERRSSMAKVAARMKKRKRMVNQAIIQDPNSPDCGVFIDRQGLATNTSVEEFSLDSSHEDTLLFQSFAKDLSSEGLRDLDKILSESNPPHSSSFLHKVMKFLSSNHVPFEHVDLWVPSFTPLSSGMSYGIVSLDNCGCCSAKCRLMFAGCSTADMSHSNQPLLDDDYFALSSFGHYSERFSFDIGCGLPGRLYQTGIPVWDNNIQNAPHNYFERIAGAVKFGIRTVVGIPIPSPSVGRIILVLYSRNDVVKDDILVERLLNAFTPLAPTPKLIVDVGSSNSAAGKLPDKQGNSMQGSSSPTSCSDSQVNDSRAATLLAVVTQCISADSSSSLSNVLPGLISLRMLLLKSTYDNSEKEIVRILWDSYNSYLMANRTSSEIGSLLAMDCMYLTQQHVGIPHFQQQPQCTSSITACNYSHFSSSDLQSVQPSQVNAPFIPLQTASESTLPCIYFTHFPT